LIDIPIKGTESNNRYVGNLKKKKKKKKRKEKEKRKI